MKRYILLLCAWCCISAIHHVDAQAIHYSSNTINHIDDTFIDTDDLASLDNDQPWRKAKKIDRLCVNCLNVTKHLCVNGQEITGDNQGGTGAPSYGQLSVLAQDILFINDNEFLPIPFNAAGPSASMGVSTTSPATITIQKDGVYQINVSLHFTVDVSDEDTFTITTYTFGLNVNGVTTPAAAVYAGEPGFFSLNYSALMTLSVNDQLQFYMAASLADGPPFANNVTLENGNAHVIQISN